MLCTIYEKAFCFQLALLVVTFAFVAPAQASEPFGIPLGTTVSSLDVVRGSSNHLYNVEVPSPHPEFHTYWVQATPRNGTCLIRGIGRSYDDGSGEFVRQAFDRLRAQLALKYGESKLASFSTSWSIWDPEDKWVSQLRDETRVHQARWSEADESKLSSDLVEILLTVDTPRSDNEYWVHPKDKEVAYLTLQYKFLNYEDCQSEVGEEKDLEFRGEAGAL